MKELLELRKIYPDILTDITLPPIAYNPPDEMNMHDCLLLFNRKVANALLLIANSSTAPPTDKAIANAFFHYIIVMVEYYELMHSTDRSFEDKIPRFKNVLTYLRIWQTSTPSNRALAPPTFRAITHTINSLLQLHEELLQQNIHCHVKTSTLSTLVVEHFFSTARSILNVFTVKQYSHIVTRTRFELLGQKSKHTRHFGRPSDNRVRTDTVYGDINITVDAPEVVRHSIKRTRLQRKNDQSIRQRIQQISAHIHSHRQPAKVN